MTPSPILYSFRRCPYAMRARLALLVSGHRIEIREVKLRDKPVAMLALSPKGTVPVLCLPDGTVVEHSLDIMRWALGRNDPEHWLSGDDADLLSLNDGPFKYYLDRTKYPERHGSDPDIHRAAALDLLHVLEVRLAGGCNLCGSGRTLADMALFPFVRQFAAVDPDWFAAQSVPRVRRWLARHVADPLFEQAMLRLSPWAEGNAPLFLGG